VSWWTTARSQKAVRVALYSIVLVAALVVGFSNYDFSGGGLTVPPVPQRAELYVSGSATAVGTASLTAGFTPEEFNAGKQRPCVFEDADCTKALERLFVDVTSKTAEAVQWMLVVSGAGPVGRKVGWRQAYLVDEGGSDSKNSVYVYRGSTASPTAPHIHWLKFRVTIAGSGGGRFALVLSTFQDQPAGTDIRWCATRAGTRQFPELIEGLNPVAPPCPARKTVKPKKTTRQIVALPALPNMSYYSPSSQSVTTSETLSGKLKLLAGYPFEVDNTASPTPLGWTWIHNPGDPVERPYVDAIDLASEANSSKDQFIGALAFGVAFAAILGLVNEFKWEGRKKKKKGGPKSFKPTPSHFQDIPPLRFGSTGKTA